MECCVQARVPTLEHVRLQYSHNTQFTQYNIHCMQCCVQARVPTPAREAQEATSSRPSSQEIASQIEGFEDDFKVYFLSC